jgi:hypothetical protein
LRSFPFEEEAGEEEAGEEEEGEEALSVEEDVFILQDRVFPAERNPRFMPLNNPPEDWGGFSEEAWVEGDDAEVFAAEEAGEVFAVEDEDFDLVGLRAEDEDCEEDEEEEDEQEGDEEEEVEVEGSSASKVTKTHPSFTLTTGFFAVMP